MKCLYKNCNKEFEPTHNKKYCSKVCRSKASVYKKRDSLKPLFSKKDEEDILRCYLDSYCPTCN